MGGNFFKKWQACLAVALISVAVHARGALDEVAVRSLPPEAQQTLALIKRGGSFPHAKEGVIFGNYEGVLPKRKRGYYHEYTVRIYGERGRGPRRIVAGSAPTVSGEYYYTADHYATFRHIRE